MQSKHELRKERALGLLREHRHLGRLDMPDTVVDQATLHQSIVINAALTVGRSHSYPVHLGEGIQMPHLQQPSLTRAVRMISPMMTQAGHGGAAKEIAKNVHPSCYLFVEILEV
jgi:hypothetical protein